MFYRQIKSFKGDPQVFELILQHHHEKVSDPGQYYKSVVYPLIMEHLGRPPILGDRWWNGERFLTYSGEHWSG
jgi:hypothetical protein